MSICLVYKRKKQQINFLNCDGKDQWIDTCNYKIGEFTGEYNGDLSELGSSCNEIRDWGTEGYYIGNCVEEIPEWFLYNRKDITSFVIPNSVKRIKRMALWGTNLSSITIPNSVVEIEDNALTIGGNLKSLTFEKGCQLTRIGNNWRDSGISSVEIPNSIVTIGDNAFMQCGDLTSVTFEEESKVTTIGDNAFLNCSSLPSIELPSTITSIGENAFRGCKSLQSITIPNGVVSFGDAAFEWCSNLPSISIPISVTDFGGSTFYYCSKLTSINYEGTKRQFNSIRKLVDWKYKVPTYCIVHCTDGDYPITDF